MLTLARFARRIALATGVLAIAVETTPAQSLSYVGGVALSRDAGLPVVSLVGAAKAPLANVGRGFGTGQWDVGAGLSSAVNVADISVFAEAVYWKMGNPQGASLRNTVAYAMSIGRVFPRDRARGARAGGNGRWVSPRIGEQRVRDCRGWPHVHCASNIDGTRLASAARHDALRRYTPAKDIHDGFPITSNNEEPNE